MIFVTLGTQDKAFDRLLKSIDKEIEKGNIKEKIIAQVGFTKYKSKNMVIYDLLSKEEFDKYVKDCSLLITHGGVGSILAGLKNNKVVIACPRLSKFSEHVNDHQLQIVSKFSKEGLLLAYNENDDLEKILELSKKFKPQKYKSNTMNMINLIEDFIEKN